MLTDITYMQSTNTVFNIPVLPGVAPVHADGATAAQILAENIHLFNQLISDHLLYHRVKAALEQQLILAVENSYIQVLEDIDLG